MQIIGRNRFRAFFLFTCNPSNPWISLYALIVLSKIADEKRSEKETVDSSFLLSDDLMLDFGSFDLRGVTESPPFPSPLPIPFHLILVMHRLACSERKKERIDACIHACTTRVDTTLKILYHGKSDFWNANALRQMEIWIQFCFTNLMNWTRKVLVVGRLVQGADLVFGAPYSCISKWRLEIDEMCIIRY